MSDRPVILEQQDLVQSITIEVIVPSEAFPVYQHSWFVHFLLQTMAVCSIVRVQWRLLSLSFNMSSNFTIHILTGLVFALWLTSQPAPAWSNCLRSCITIDAHVWWIWGCRCSSIARASDPGIISWSFQSSLVEVGNIIKYNWSLMTMMNDWLLWLNY